MGQSTSEVRDDIEQTRERMSDTIDAIADRTSPARIADRQRRRLRDGMHRLRETVMGSAEGAYSSAASGVQGLAESAQHGVSTAADQLGHAPEMVKRQTQGSPLAAGLIAFGAGALAAAVIPSTRRERQAAARLQQEAEPAIEQLKHVGGQMADDVKGAARQAVEEVKSTAQESAHTVAEEAKGAADQVREQAAGSTERVVDDTKTALQGVDGGDDPARDELYARAQELDIPGRSQMNKAELAEAINEAENRLS
jgi:hypothetical protein